MYRAVMRRARRLRANEEEGGRQVGVQRGEVEFPTKIIECCGRTLHVLRERMSVQPYPSVPPLRAVAFVMAIIILLLKKAV